MSSDSLPSSLTTSCTRSCNVGNQSFKRAISIGYQRCASLSRPPDVASHTPMKPHRALRHSVSSKPTLRWPPNLDWPSVFQRKLRMSTHRAGSHQYPSSSRRIARPLAFWRSGDAFLPCSNPPLESPPAKSSRYIQSPVARFENILADTFSGFGGFGTTDIVPCCFCAVFVGCSTCEGIKGFAIGGESFDGTILGGVV